MLLSSTAPIAGPVRPTVRTDAPTIAIMQYAHKTAAGADGSSDIAMGVVMPNPFQQGAAPLRIAAEGTKPAGVTDAKLASQRMYDANDPAQVAALAGVDAAVAQAGEGLKALQSNVDPAIATDKAKASAWMDAAAPGSVLVVLGLSDGTQLAWAGDWATAPAPLAGVLAAYDAAGKTFTPQAPKQG